ncbi:MAG: hypothetical protein JOY83_26430 [Alphaproteobacteria bacterium]|nr:hypothetical protein [Alphaproteobacteria bacterium]
MPTLRLDHLTEASARAFRIADNRLTEISTWDDQLLAEQLNDLSLLGLDFSLEQTGFEMGEIDLRIASLKDPVEAKDDPADVLPYQPTSPPVSQIGDIWRLGDHYLACANVARLLGPRRALASIGEPASNAAPQLSTATRRVRLLLDEKAQLLARVRRDVGYKAMMDFWLYFHVPLSFALLAALLAHVVAVFYLW